jgi:Rv2525c-like, glycoside hydrolase-like domain
VWETDGIMRSEAEGATAARSADAQLKLIGAPGAVVFFAADAATMPDLHGYMTGAVSVLGKARTGIYGGLGSVQAAFDAGLVTYGWQTYAWSAGQWDDRALLRQVRNDVKFGPATVDLDQAAFWASSKILGPHDDYGQYPKPSAQRPSPQPPDNPEPITTGGNESLRDLAHNHGITTQVVLWWTARNKPHGFGVEQGGYISNGNWDANLPAGTIWWVGPTPS